MHELPIKSEHSGRSFIRQVDQRFTFKELVGQQVCAFESSVRDPNAMEIHTPRNQRSRMGLFEGYFVGLSEQHGYELLSKVTAVPASDVEAKRRAV